MADAPPTPRRRPLKWAAGLGLALIAAIVLGAAGLLAFAETQTARDFLADRAGQALSDESLTVRIIGLEGSVTSSFRIDKITVADRDGVFVTLGGSRILWHPLALFDRAIRIETLSVGRIAVTRLPRTEYASSAEPPEDTTSAFDVRIGKIDVGEIEIAPPVMGEAQRLSAAASVSLGRDLSSANLDLTLRRIDGGRDRAKIKVDYAAAPARFDARVQVEEPAGGVLARLARLPRGDRLFIDLAGKGPPNAWKGALTFESGSDLAVRTGVSLSIHEGETGISMEGTARISSLLPRELAPLAAPAARFRTDATFVPSDGLSIRRFMAESDLLTLSGTGRYRLTDRSVAAAITGKVHDRPALSAVLPGILVGNAGFDAKVEGTAAEPRASLSFQTDEIAAGPVRVASTTGSIDLMPRTSESFDVKGTIKADGFDPGDAIPDWAVGRALDLAVSGNISRDGTRNTVTLSAVSGPSKVNASGRLNHDGVGEGNYSVNLDDMEPLARTAGLALKGRFDAEGRFRMNLPAGSVHFTAQGSMSELATTTPGLDPLLGRHVPFSGEFEWREGGPFTIASFNASPAIGPLDGQGTVDTGSGAVSAKLNLSVADLKPLSSLAGVGLGGSTMVSATLEGPPQAVTARGDARIAGLSIDHIPVGRFDVAYNVHLGGATVKTRLQIDGNADGRTVKGGLNSAIGKDSIDLSGIDIMIGKSRLTGKLGVDLARKRLSGEVKASMKDLGDLPGATEIGLSGTGEITAVTEAGREPTILITGTARDVLVANTGANRTEIEKATARFRLRNPFASLTATGEIDLEDFRVAGLREGKAKFTIDGNASAMDWSIVSSAGGDYPVLLSSNGAFSRSLNRWRLSVAKLKGKVAEQDVRLDAPFAVTWQPKEWRVDPIDFTFADGRFQLAGSMAGGKFDATGQFDNLSLQLVSLIDPRFQMDGTVTGNLRASGGSTGADLTLSVAANGIRPPDATQADFAGFNLAVDIRQNNQGADGMVKLTGPEQTEATLSLQSKRLVSLSPLAIDLGGDVPITGKLSANGRLDLIDKLVGLGEDRISGQINAKAAMTGTVGNPVVHGEARLTGGTYEGAATGTVLQKIDGNIVFTGDNARLVSLTADDGATGRLSGTGEVRFTGSGASSGGIDIRLDRFTALRHPQAEAVITGGMTVSGSLDALKLAGRFQVETGEIAIPEQLPEQIVQLDVVEINGQAANIATPSGAAEPSLAKTYPVSLDIAVDIPGRTFVRGRGLSSEWKGDLTVKGKSDAPIVGGKLEAVRGTFAFAGKTFVLKSGSVTFPGSAAEPEIAVVAEAALRDLVARVTLSGNISKPVISISSDPELPQEDVLAQILFGRTAGQLSAIQAAQLAQTAATLSGKGGAGLVDKVRQALGVDVLNMESEEGSGKGASLKAGKYLTEDIFLSVTQGTRAGSQKVGVEVQVLPNITVESDISGAADSNIGLNWKWNY